MTPLRPIQQWIRRSPNYKWWAAAATVTLTVVEVSHLGAVNIAQPNIADRFGSDLPTVQWVTLSHMLAISALLLPMGRLSDMVGRKRVFVGGMLAFIGATALAATATNLTALILFRALQGIGTAMILANGMAIVISLFSDRQRGTALGLHAMAVGLGLVIGPALGGLILGTLGWRYVFVMFIPMGLLSLVPFLIVVDERHVRESSVRVLRDSFDWAGSVISTVALVVFLLAVTHGHRMGWDSPLVLSGLGVSVGLLSGFVWWELHTPAPLIDVRLFKSRLFSLAVAVRSLFFISGAAPIFLMPFYLLGVVGYSAGQAGLILTVMAVVMVVNSPMGGRLTDRLGWRPVALGGAALSSAGLFFLAQLNASTSLYVIILALVLQSSSNAMLSLPTNSAVLGSVERDKHSLVSAFLQMLRNTFTITGIAVATVIVTAVMASKGVEPSLAVISENADTRATSAFISGMRATFLAMAGLQVVSMLLLVFSGRWSLGLFAKLGPKLRSA